MLGKIFEDNSFNAETLKAISDIDNNTNLSKIQFVMEQLVLEKTLSTKYRDHSLVGGLLWLS
jgi:mRNA-degrading endonuclease YafQ of YafQ-DinJ toxin-antitoxin module